MAFRVGGISSGLDTASIVEQLMQVERQPLSIMQNKKTMVSLKKELFSEINSSLVSLSGSLEKFFSNSTWDQLSVTSTDSDILSATAGDDAVSGIYKFTDIQLATNTWIEPNKTLEQDGAPAPAQVSSSAEIQTGAGSIDPEVAIDVAGFESAISSGTITINDISFEVDPTTMTLDDLMSEINGSTAGVTMSYDAGTDLITLASNNDGASAEIDITQDETGLFAAANIDISQTYTGTGTANPTAKLVDSNITDLTPEGDSLYFKINGVAFSFDVNIHSLNRVLDEINSSDAGVNVIYDSETDSISMSSKETGSKSIALEDIHGNFLDAIGVLGGTEHIGAEASFKLNGVSMQRDSNEFEINGIDFNLLEGANSSATVTVNKDVEGIYNSVKEFVDQYNSTITLLNTRLSEEKLEEPTTEAGLRKGLLRGDSTVMGIRSSLRTMVSSNASGLSNSFDNLWDIGITTTSDDFGKSGLLEIDEAKLKEAIENNPDEVKKLFFDDTDDDERYDDGEIGVAASLYSKIQSYVSTKTTSYNDRTYKVGVIPMRLDSMDAEIDRYDDRIADFELRLEQVEERYWRQFNAMEEAMQSLSNQGAWLTNQLASLG